MLNIVYPLIDSGWHELKYSLRSLERHLKEDFKVWVIGDYLPPWITNAEYIKTPRYFPPSQDTGSKLRLCTYLFDSFVWMNDDIYLAQDCALRELKTAQAKEKYTHESHQGAIAWVELANKSYTALANIMPRKELYNYVLHVPMFLESKKLRVVHDAIPIFNGDHDAVICYFNWHGPAKPKTRTDRYVLPTDLRKLPNGQHKFLNSTENGLSDSVKKFLQDKYCVPSKYEIEEVCTPGAPVSVYYCGKKINYKYKDYDFSSGCAQVPSHEAKWLKQEFPRSFRIG